jgi:hypothetical protein
MTETEEDRVKAILGDFHSRLRVVVEKAWAEWEAYPSRAILVFPKRYRANFIFDAIARLSILEFSSDPNVHVLPQKQTVHFLIKQQVYLRFKKGNAKGVGSNIETQAVLNFIDPQRSIPGMLPDIFRIEVCWQPNDLGTRLDDIAVVARDFDKRRWAYSLPRGAAEDTAPVVALPPRAPPASEAPPVVTPKRRKDGKENKSE